jgi:hypothetical protein
LMEDAILTGHFSNVPLSICSFAHLAALWNHASF